jgi:hypothetical protein
MKKLPWKCGLCGGFIRRGPKGQCSKCKTEWDNGESCRPSTTLSPEKETGK